MEKRLLIFLICVNFVTATDYYVAQDGSGDFTSIQSAVDAANSGDIIYISPGVYHEEIIINKPSLTLEGSDPLNPPMIDGADQELIDVQWEYISDNVYRTPFTWRGTSPDTMSGTYRGGKDHAPLMLYEDNTCLAGYEIVSRQCWTGGGIRPFDDISELRNDYCPNCWLEKTKNVPGKFMVKDGYLYVHPATGEPMDHTYYASTIFHLIQINAAETTLRNLIIAHAQGYAVVLEDADGSIIEDCYFPNNKYSIWIKNTDDFKVLRNFISNKGYWERHEYCHGKEAILWGHSIDVEGFSNSRNGEIAYNVIHGDYSGLGSYMTFGQDLEIHDNIVSHHCSTNIDATLVHERPYNLHIYRNVIHHVDDNSIGISYMSGGPVYVYRNVFYAHPAITKDGAGSANRVEGDTYLYHNTFAYISTLTHHPYTYPVYGNTKYYNNIVHLDYGSDNAYWRYYTENGKTGGWGIPFDNGPDADYNLYWHAGSSNTIGRFINGPVYYKGDFDRMVSETGLDTHGLEANPGFTGIDIETLDSISKMDYQDVIDQGYMVVFRNAFEDMYENTFGVGQDSPAINRGTVLSWPDSVNLNDLPDIGHIEYSDNSGDVCGDGNCDAECDSCPADCSFTDCCPDGDCNNDETCETCEADCGVCLIDCVHEADLPVCDGCVDTTELVDYMGLWKTGTVEMTQLMEVIGLWKDGC